MTLADRLSTDCEKRQAAEAAEASLQRANEQTACVRAARIGLDCEPIGGDDPAIVRTTAYRAERDEGWPPGALFTPRR